MDEARQRERDLVSIARLEEEAIVFRPEWKLESRGEPTLQQHVPVSNVRRRREERLRQDVQEQRSQRLDGLLNQ